MNENAKIRAYEWIFFIIITLNTILTSMDADLYVPSFPNMMVYFDTNAESIQLILGASFLGLCIASLFYGPLADSLGRRKPLVVGMLIFTVGSWGSYQASSIDSLIGWRFIQGFGSAAPIIVGAAALFDYYKEERAIQLISIWNSIGTASMATAPLFGAALDKLYGWRANFLFISIFAVSIFAWILLGFKETLKPSYRKPVSPRQAFSNYYKIASHLPYLAHSTVCALLYSALMVYISNSSLIFVNHLHIDPTVFSYYQASTMTSFVIFSIICAPIISRYGIDRTKQLGIIFSFMGAFALLLTAILHPLSPFLISSSMALFAAGVAFAIGIFGARSMEFFPKLRATAAALGTAIRLLITSCTLALSGYLYDGTITPIAVIIFVMMIVNVILALYCAVHPVPEHKKEYSVSSL